MSRVSQRIRSGVDVSQIVNDAAEEWIEGVSVMESDVANAPVSNERLIALLTRIVDKRTLDAIRSLNAWKRGGQLEAVSSEHLKQCTDPHCSDCLSEMHFAELRSILDSHLDSIQQQVLELRCYGYFETEISLKYSLVGDRVELVNARSNSRIRARLKLNELKESIREISLVSVTNFTRLVRLEPDKSKTGEWEIELELKESASGVFHTSRELRESFFVRENGETVPSCEVTLTIENGQAVLCKPSTVSLTRSKAAGMVEGELLLFGKQENLRRKMSLVLMTDETEVGQYPLIISSESKNFCRIGPGSSHLCTACSSSHKCLYTDAAYYDEQAWDVGRGTVVPSAYGYGNAVGELVLCYSVDTCQEDCVLIPGSTNYRCVYDSMEDVYEVIDETAWGACP